MLAPHLSLPVPEVVATGEPAEGYPFPWAVVRWLPGEDAVTERFASLPETAVALGRFVAELQAIDMTEAPPPGSEGFSRGLPLAGTPRSAGPAPVRGTDRRPAGDRGVGRRAGGPRLGRATGLAARRPDPAEPAGARRPLAGVLDFGAMATGDPAYDVTPAWHVLDRDSRAEFLEIVGADDATRRRARGLVVSYAVFALSYYLHTNPTMVAIARRGVEEVLADE